MHTEFANMLGDGPAADAPSTEGLREARRQRRKPELLAPAGTWDAFVAALDAGADAIYLGLDSFNARQNAENFTLEMLERACRMAHLAGRRVYLTLNILIATHEMDEALELVEAAYRAGIDAVIVQDIGLLVRMHSRLPGLEIHTSTQMNLCNVPGIDLARRLGATRVTLARELSLAEIAELAGQGLDLEVFAHGALCVCYSGQCLMSSLIGRRSANRGLCAQPCRLPWTLVDGSGAAPEVAGEHLLSTRDLCTVDILPELIDAGVASLKVEGRMKSPEYVSLVCGVYRACIDRAFADPGSYRVGDDERNRLEEAFSRGFTTAYLEGERGNAMMGYARPNNRGVAVGRVSHIADGRVEFSLTRDIGMGDVLEFWTARGRQAQTIAEMTCDGVSEERAYPGEHPSMVVPFPVAPGDRIFRVRNAELGKGPAERSAAYAGVPMPLAFEVTARLGEPLALVITDAEGRQGRAEGRSVERARTKALSRDDIVEHVGRLGNTPYEVRSFDIHLDEGVGLGFSQLHHLRSDAIADLEGHILAPWNGREAASVVVPPVTATRPVGGSGSVAAQVAAIVSEPAVLASCIDAGVQVLYIPDEKYTELVKLIPTGKGAPECCRLLPTVIHDAAWRELVDRLDGTIACVADDAASIAPLAEKGLAVEAGPHANVLNDDSLRTLYALGATRLWLSPELSLSQITALAKDAEASLTLTVYGRQELMMTEHCVLQAQEGCGHGCDVCSRRTSGYALIDRKGYRFPVVTDADSRSHILNSLPLDIIPQIPQLHAGGVTRFVVDARMLHPDEAARAIGRACAACRVSAQDAGHPLVKDAGTTTGHLFRGVL